jgi:hypothetical protein
MHVSKKNQPVVDRLILLLAQSENVADAILDNALDDGERLDPQVVAGLMQYLVRTADILNAAEQADLTVPE